MVITRWIRKSMMHSMTYFVFGLCSFRREGNLWQLNDLTGFGGLVGYESVVETSVIVHYYLHRNNDIPEFHGVVG